MKNEWKARFAVGVIMLGLAFFGVFFSDIKVKGGFDYWRIMSPVYAVLSIGLTLYLKHMNLKESLVTIWQEVLHWSALVGAVYLVSTLVGMEFISRMQAGVQVLMLLALSTFLAGVYLEATFIVVGLTLALMVVTVTFFDVYLYVIPLPLIGLALIALYFIARRKKE